MMFNVLMVGCAALTVMLGYLVSTHPLVLVLPLLGVYALAWFVIPHKFVHPDWYQPERDHTKGLRQDIVGAAVGYYAGCTKDPHSDYGLHYDDVEITGEEKEGAFTLRGWHVPVSAESKVKNKICIVCVHGAGRDRRAFMRHMRFLNSAGYGLLAFDCREHGTSSILGRGVGWLVREPEDVGLASQFARTELGYDKVVLLGTSQGAASSILSAVMHDDSVEAVIAENPYSSRDIMFSYVLDIVFGRTLPGLSLLKDGMVSLASWRIKKRIGISDELHPNPIDVVHRLQQPLLLMHGTADKLTLPHHSEDLHRKAADPKQLWVLDGAEHTALWDHAPEEYEKRVLGFLEEHGLRA